MIVKKVWGYEDVLVTEPEYTLKELHIYPKKRCSMHFHPKKKETFYIKSGMVRLEQLNISDELLKPGESRTIMPKTPHRFSSMYGAIIFEVSTRHDDLDVVRLEPSGEAKA